MGLFTTKRTKSPGGAVTRTKTKNNKTGKVSESVSLRLGNNTRRSTNQNGKSKTTKTW